MKKNKTINKLTFNKVAITELNDATLIKVNGRHLLSETVYEPTTFACSNCITIMEPISLQTIIKQL